MGPEDNTALYAESRREIDGAVRLREEHRKIYPWDIQCTKFKEIMQGLTDRPASAVAVGSNGMQCERMFLQCNYSTVTKATVTKFTNWITGLSLKLQVVGYIQSVGGELSSLEVL